MFSRQIERLQRKKWKDPNELAQEVAAILGNARLPLYHEGQIILQAQGNEPQVIFRNSGDDGQTPIQFQRRPEAPFSLVYTGGLLVFNGQAATAGTAGTAGGGGEGEEGGASVFPGTIVSGTGENYEVEILGGGTVSAVARGPILDDEEIPAGTQVLMVKYDDVYYLHPPLWM